MKWLTKTKKVAFECPNCGHPRKASLSTCGPVDKFQRCPRCQSVYVVMWDSDGVGTNLISRDYDGDLSGLARWRNTSDLTDPGLPRELVDA